LALINRCCFCNCTLSGSMARPCLMVDRAASYCSCSDCALARR
jgi:hypothetical protein